MPEITKCPQCGTAVQRGQQFCGNCGTKLESRCPNAQCGAVLHGNEKFCPNCGTAVTTAAVPPGNEIGTEQPSAATVASAVAEAASPPTVQPAEIFLQSLDLQNADIRLKRGALNLVFLKLQRRYGIITQSVQSPSPEIVEAFVQAVDSHIAGLEQDPSSSAQAFLPLARQAAATWLFFTLHLGPPEALGTDAVESCPLPSKYKSLLRSASGEKVMWLARSFVAEEFGLFWSPGTFLSVEAAFGNDTAAFSSVVCQSLRELFHLTYPTPALGKRFLAEEDFKVKNGYYPESIRQDVEQFLVRLKIAGEKRAKEVANPSALRDGLLLGISPLSLARVADQAAQIAALTGLMSNPYPYRALTPTEEAAFQVFVGHGLEPSFQSKDLLTWLLSMRDEQDSNAGNFGTGLSGFQQEGFFFFYMLFEVAHCALTRYCNILGARLDGKYAALPHRQFRLPSLTWDKMKAEFAKSDKDFAMAMLPESKTIEMIARELMASKAVASAA